MICEEPLEVVVQEPPLAQEAEPVWAEVNPNPNIAPPPDYYPFREWCIQKVRQVQVLQEVGRQEFYSIL